jgi:pimeloyl-ACP methyl ester carboxylesterase
MPPLTTHTLDVPRARLYYERRGSGPPLLVIGSPMDSTGFAPLADALAQDCTVVTYDPRGIGNSSREDATVDPPGQGTGSAAVGAPTGAAARFRATNEQFLGHMIRPTTGYRPDLDALRAASTRIVVAAGAESKGQLANGPGR